MAFLDRFLDALRRVEPFPNQRFVNRLYNKAINCRNVSLFKGNLASQDNFGPDPESPVIDGFDATPLLEALAQHAAVKGLAQYAPGADPHDLRSCANTSAADALGDNAFVQSSTLLYAEHINWQLVKNGSNDLRVLRQNSDFVNALDRTLRSKHFIKGALRQDLVAHDHSYTTALLFVYDYLYFGPGFLPHVGDRFRDAPSGTLLAAWCSELLYDLPFLQQASGVQFFAKASSLVHTVTNTAGDMQAQPSLNERVLLLIALGIAPFELSELLENDTDVWKSMCHVNKELWADTQNKWTNAVISIAGRSNSNVREIGDEGQKFGEGLLQGITFGAVKHQTWRKTTITGLEVADWINEGRRGPYSQLFTKDAPNVVNTDVYTTVNSAKSCFIAGTQVATEDGLIAIEKITEGTRVLTGADPTTYGVVSDEDVVVHLNVPFLCGINDEKPFFTPGHVFHTVAGLKAVDPASAKLDNPWLEVGQLATGHILYRLAKDGQGYEQIVVNSIKIEESEGSEVYGVHLRDGHRSYHANGYLVAVNYPEITVKSIAKALATFPRHQQTAMLLHIKELQPVFQRFGIATMSDVLKRELRGMKRREVSKPHSVNRRRVTSYLRHARRTYALYSTESQNTDYYRLPTLTIHDGTVLLDGVVATRAVIDSDDRTIRWTRQVRQYGYEHGYADLLNHGLAGNGIVLLSEDPDLEKPSNTSIQRWVKFVAAKPTAKFYRSYSRDVVDLADAALAKGADINPNYIDNVDEWDMLLDRDVWPVGEARTMPVNPVPLGKVNIETYHAGGETGIPIPIMTMPILDDLCDAINAKYKGTNKGEIETLYSSVVQRTSEGNQIGTIWLESPALLYQLADKPEGSEELKSMLNVTFQKSLGTDIVLPILFRTLALESTQEFLTTKGVATEYNADNRGGDGDRHFLEDVDSVRDSMAALKSRSAISKALATARPTPIGITAAKSQAPAPVTKMLRESIQLSVGELEAIPNYSSAAIHDRSQALLQNMMLFHMNEDSRTKFLQTSKPDNLPLLLGDNLSSELKTWIHDTYAPAYISFMLAQVKNANVNWRNNFSEAEKSKIWYWWSGQGTKCLAKSKEYNQLNSLTAVAAVRLLHSTTLDKYIADDPKGWAQTMLEEITRSKHAFSNYIRAPLGGGESILNKHCNILNALDPSGDFADKFFNQVVAYAIAQHINTPLRPLDKDAVDRQEGWLNDTMKTLIVMVLNNDPSLPGEVKTSLLKDLNALEKQEGINENQAATLRADEILTKVAELTTTMATNMGNVEKVVKLFSRTSGYQKAAAVFNNTLGSSPKLGKFAMMKGAFTVAMVVGYGIVAYSSFSNWDNLTDPQKAIAIIATLAMVTDILKKGIQTFEAVKEWKAGQKDLPPNEAAAAESLDQELSSALRSPEGAVRLNSINENVVGTDLKSSNAEVFRLSEEQPLLPAEGGGRVGGYGTFEPGKPLVEEMSEKVPPADLPPTARKSWKEFATGKNFLKLANICIGIALTAAMCFDLAKNWDSYTDAGKALNVLQVVIQGLCVIIDVAVFIGDALVSAGIMAAECTMMVALPVLGAILAVIGMIVTIILASLNIVKKQDPPPTPVESFINDISRPWIKKTDDPPALSLAYNIGKSVKAGQGVAVPIAVSNSSNKDVTLTNTTITLEVGDDDAALFSGPIPAWTLANRYQPDVTPLSTAGTVGVSPADLASATLIDQVLTSKQVHTYDLKVMGPAKVGIAGPLKIPRGHTVFLSWMGTINKAGSTTMQIIETLQNGDKCRFLTEIVRS